MDNKFFKKIHLSNSKNRDASVNFVSLTQGFQTIFLHNNHQVHHARLLADTLNTGINHIMKHHEKNYLQKIMQEDVDVDVERFGRFIDDTEKVLLNSKNQMFHSAPKVIEVVYDTKGEEIKQQEPSNIDPNVRDDTPPLKWTGKFFPREEIIGKFVFKRSIQFRILCYD